MRPRLSAEILGEILEALGVMLDEIVRENLAAGALVFLEHLLHDALEERDVAIDAHGEKEAGELGAAAEQVAAAPAGS